MNERKWTKGPWEVVPASNDDEGFPLFYDVMRTGNYTGTVAGCYNSRQLRDGISRDESLANAHLIAAAPDLYEALEEANNVIRGLAVCYLKTLPDGDERGFFPLYDRMKSALARARGEA